MVTYSGKSREDTTLKEVLAFNHPWEHNFPKRAGLEAIAIAARFTEAGHATPTSPSIGWYESKRDFLKTELRTDVIDVIDQLIEMVAPSSTYNEEEIIGGQYSPPSPQPERITQPPVVPERITQLPIAPIEEDLERPWVERAKEAAIKEQQDRERRLSTRRLYSERYGTGDSTTDPVTLERGGYEEAAEDYFESILSEIPSEVLEAEEGEEDASGERYQTDLEYCPECDAYYKPGIHTHQRGLDDPYNIIDILDEDEEYSDYSEEEEDFY